MPHQYTIVDRLTLVAPSAELSVSISFFLLVFIAYVPFYFGLGSSLSLGTCGASACICLVSIYQWPVDTVRVNRRSTISSSFMMLVAAAVISMHSLIVALYQPFDFRRAAASFLPLTLVVGAGSALGGIIRRCRASRMHRAILFLFVLFFIEAVLAVVDIEPFSPHASPKPVFPFTEPSQFALLFAPVLLYRCVTSRGWHRVAFLMVGGAIALMLENLTLFVACTICAFICLRTISLFVGVLSTGYLLSGINYYLDRLDFSSSSTNLSALIYVQGWQLVCESLERSLGWGVGFQQLGVWGTQSTASEAIYDLIGYFGNLLDGGFTFAKLIGEFGVIGFFLIAAYLAVACKAALHLRRFAFGVERIHPARVFAYCSICTYGLELFVRGTGYFSPNSIFLVASLVLLPAFKEQEVS